MAVCARCKIETSNNYPVAGPHGVRYVDLCPKCYEAIKNDSKSKKERIIENKSNDSRPSYSSFFKVIAFLFLIVGFLAGIGVGNLEKPFSLSLAGYVWGGSVLSFLIFWAIYSILRNEETIIENQETIIEMLDKDKTDN